MVSIRIEQLGNQNLFIVRSPTRRRRIQMKAKLPQAKDVTATPAQLVVLAREQIRAAPQELLAKFDEKDRIRLRRYGCLSSSRGGSL